VSRTERFDHQFVDRVPDHLVQGVLYISLEYRTAIHLCACGCESEIVTPLRPDKWSMTFDGASVSLQDSIGNWSFPCRSHYWISQGGWVWWARTWSDGEVAMARARGVTGERDDRDSSGLKVPYADR
jgi:hypothetical protein